MSPSVRLASPSDAPFLIASNRAMAWETEHKELPVDRITPGVLGLFSHPEYGFYVIAEADGSPAGCLMVTYEWSDWRNGLVWWIQSVYVVPEQRRKGLYRALYLWVKAKAAAEPAVRGFRLYVEKENEIAQKTYQSLGMIDAGYYLFEEMV